MECGEALAQGLHIIIGPLNQRFACDVVCHRLLGRANEKHGSVCISGKHRPTETQVGGADLLEFSVVCTAATRMDQSSGDTRYEESVVYLHLHD